MMSAGAADAKYDLRSAAASAGMRSAGMNDDSQSVLLRSSPGRHKLRQEVLPCVGTLTPLLSFLASRLLSVTCLISSLPFVSSSLSAAGVEQRYRTEGEKRNRVAARESTLHSFTFLLSLSSPLEVSRSRLSHCPVGEAKRGSNR